MYIINPTTLLYNDKKERIQNAFYEVIPKILRKTSKAEFEYTYVFNNLLLQCLNDIETENAINGNVVLKMLNTRFIFN